MIDKKTVDNVLKIYKEAWERQDPEKILTIFTEDAVYREYVLKNPLIGHRQIRGYWQKKVVEEQSEIKFKVLNVYIDGNTVIAEWDAVFYSRLEKKTIHLVEVAILEFEGEKIKSLREYWHSERKDTVS